MAKAAAEAEEEMQTQYAIFSCEGIVSKCVSEFAEAFSLEIVETITNGDCFFDSLLLSGAIMEPASNSNKKEQERLRQAQRLALRQSLVGYLEDPVILAELAAFGYNDIYSNIQKLRKSGVYRCDAGDLPTQFAHNAFGIHLNVFVIDYHKATKRTVVTLEKHVNDNPYVPTVPTVNVLRIGEHFKLLEPQIDLANLDRRIQQGVQKEKPYYNERRLKNALAANEIKAARAAEKAKQKAKQNAASAKPARGNTKKSPKKEETEENIMKRMMELSLKTAKEEEEKRQANATKKNRELSAARKQMAENEALAKKLAGLNLKDSPNAKAKTQKEWAAELGLSVSTISKLQKEMREQGLTMNLKNYKAAKNAQRNLNKTAKKK